MTIREFSFEIANLAVRATCLGETKEKEAQAHINMAADLLLQAKSHMQTASRIEGDTAEVKP